MDAEKLQKAVAEELAAKRIGQSLQMYGGVFLGLNSLGRTKWIKRKEPPGAMLRYDGRLTTPSACPHIVTLSWLS
jgi:hypothetical protein